MEEALFTITNSAGLHARPAAHFVRTAAGFQSSVRVRNLSRDAEREADAKSILSVMTLGIEQGHIISITVDGPDEAAAIEALRALVEGNIDK
jgi:phosphotransferase system HPr (HPr) family protein